jgi:DNA modification methylase
MPLLRDGQGDLVFTSPPYFSEDTYLLLKAPVRQQTEYDRVQSDVTAFALSLRPQFQEIVRVLRPGGTLVLQTKDLRYGGFLITLVPTHRELLETLGLRLVTRVFWHKRAPRQRRAPQFLKNPRVGSFEADDVEEFLVFSHTCGIQKANEALALDEADARRYAAPIWDLPSGGRAQTHPFQSPPAVVERFLMLYSRPGDLVVDPFAGHGTTLRLAAAMDRRAIGYEIDGETAAIARAFLQNEAERRQSSTRNTGKQTNEQS